MSFFANYFQSPRKYLDAGPARQGTSLAISGDGTVLTLGGPQDNTDIGALWIFV